MPKRTIAARTAASYLAWPTNFAPGGATMSKQPSSGSYGRPPKAPVADVRAEADRPKADGPDQGDQHLPGKSIYAAGPEEWRAVGYGLWAIVFTWCLNLVIVLVWLAHLDDLSLYWQEQPNSQQFETYFPTTWFYVSCGLAILSAIANFLGLASCAAAPLRAAGRRFALAGLLFAGYVLSAVALAYRFPEMDHIAFLTLAAIAVFCALAWKIAYFTATRMIAAQTQGLGLPAVRRCRQVRIVGGLGLLSGLLALLLFAAAVSSVPNVNLTPGRITVLCLAVGGVCAVVTELCVPANSLLLAPFILKQRAYQRHTALSHNALSLDGSRPSDEEIERLHKQITL